MDSDKLNRAADPARAPGTAAQPDSPPPNQFYAPDPAMGKRCPLCAELVNAAAHICHFCGYSFDDGTSAEARAVAAARLNAIEAARLAKGGRRGFYLRLLRMLLPLLFLLFVFALVGIILMNEFGQIGGLTKTPAPAGAHSSPTAAKTLSIAPSAYFSDQGSSSKPQS